VYLVTFFENIVKIYDDFYFFLHYIVLYMIRKSKIFAIDVYVLRNLISSFFINLFIYNFYIFAAVANITIIKKLTSVRFAE